MSGASEAAMRAAAGAGVTGGETREHWPVMALVQWSGDYLRGKGVQEGRLDAEHLLAHVLGLNRLELYLAHDRPVTPDERAAFKPLLLRRAAREPLQHIVGRAAFRELELEVDAGALIPRPETEELVGHVLDRCAGVPGGSALDLGTGSGCIALSLVVEGRFERVVATDVSPEALAVARRNAQRVPGARALELRQGDLFEPVRGEVFDVIVSNPPYVARRERETLEPEVREHEPEIALYGGEDGLDVARALVAGAPRHLRAGGLLALELGSGQCDAVVALLEATLEFAQVASMRDLSGRPRFVLARRTH